MQIVITTVEGLLAALATQVLAPALRQLLVGLYDFFRGLLDSVFDALSPA